MFTKKFALMGMVKSVTSKETKKITDPFINQPMEKVLRQEGAVLEEQRIKYSLDNHKHLFQLADNDYESTQHPSQV